MCRRDTDQPVYEFSVNVVKLSHAVVHPEEPTIDVRYDIAAQRVSTDPVSERPKGLGHA